MHHPSVSWNIIPLNFSSCNIICFSQKGSINVQFVRRFSALMKFHPILHAIFGTTRSEFIQILQQWSVLCKINSLHFFGSNLIYSGQKEPVELKFLMSYFKSQVSFSIYLLSVIKIILLCFFSCKNGQRSPSKCKISDFWPLTSSFTKSLLW